MPALPNETQDLIPGVGVGTTSPIDTMGGVRRTPLDLGKFSEMALRFQQEQDNVLLDNAKADYEKRETELRYGKPDENGVLQGGWMTLHGIEALRPDADGKGLAQRTDEALDGIANEIAATLPQAARIKFLEDYSRNKRNTVYNDVSRYVLQQNEVFKKSSAEGNVRSAQQNAAVSIANADVFARDLAIVEQNTRKYGAYMGLSAEDINSQVRTNQSWAISAGIANLLQVAEKTPQQAYAALDVLNKYSPKMLADDVVKLRTRVQSVIDREKKAVFVEDTAPKLIRNMGLFSKNGIAAKSADSAEGLFSIIIDHESSGRQFDTKTGKTLVGQYPDGSLPKEPLRSYGISQMQVATAKETAERLGQKFDPKRFMEDREYNYSLGVAHFSNLITQYGDVDLAAAAYHQGVGNVNKALKQAKEKGGTWFDYIGKGGQDYVAKFRKVRQNRLAGKGSSEMNIFYAAGHKQYGMDVSRDDCYKVVKETYPLAKINEAEAAEMTDALYARVQKLQKDEQTRQTNGACAIMNWLTENDYDINRVPERLKSQVTPMAFAQLVTRSKALRDGDTSGDRRLGITLLNSDELLLGMEENAFQLALYSLPSDLRQRVQDKRWALQTKQKDAEHHQAIDVRNAQRGVYNPDNVLKISQINTLLSYAMGPEEWKKLDEDQRAAISANFQKFRGENQTTENRANNDIEELEVAKRFLSTEYDTGWLFASPKNYARLKKGDLFSGQVGNVREICTELAKGKIAKRNENREPSDGEILDAFIELDSMRYPDISGLKTGVLSADRVNWVVSQYKQANGGRLPNDVEIVKYYVRSLMNGEKVPEKEEATTTSDAFFRAIEANDFSEELGAM